MAIILWILSGAFVGWVASLIMRSEQGFVVDAIVGIIGALIGGFLMGFIGKSGVQGFTFYSFLVALLGACILIALVRAIR